MKNGYNQKGQYKKQFIKIYENLKQTLGRYPTRKDLKEFGFKSQPLTKILKRLAFDGWIITYPFNKNTNSTTIKIENKR